MIDFHTVYQRHAGELRRFALYLSGNPAIADDLVADAFVRLWTTTGEIRTETIKGYLIAIVRNLYLNSRRRGARDVPLDDTHVVVDLAASIDTRLEQREQLALVRATLASLAEIDRSALLLRALHEMPYEEIARVLEISVAAAKVKVHRARLRLAAVLTKEKVLS
ncbi:MAG: RNA polymerase sigma factor [Acidobacteriota bacterium]